MCLVHFARSLLMMAAATQSTGKDGESCIVVTAFTGIMPALLHWYKDVFYPGIKHSQDKEMRGRWSNRSRPNRNVAKSLGTFYGPAVKSSRQQCWGCRHAEGAGHRAYDGRRWPN